MLKSSKSSKVDGEVRESEHFCYVCVKKHDADKLCRENWLAVQEEVLKEQAEDDSFPDYEDDDEDNPW